MPLPRDVDAWWRARSQMRLVQQNGVWTIEGPQAERARVAWASLDKGAVVYTMDGKASFGTMQQELNDLTAATSEKR
jgi:hypothetical protein